MIFVNVMLMKSSSLTLSFTFLGSKSFYLFGCPIKSSFSPIIHQTGFDELKLPYKYELFETNDPDVVGEKIKETDFGGASVTIPLKSSLWNLMDAVSDAARDIGALNTIVKLPNGQFFGENTDWKGISLLLNEKIQVSNRAECKVILIGAGGAARAALYALKKLGFTNKILIYNPYNLEQATALAQQNVIVVQEEKELHEDGIGLIICTVPASSRFTFDETYSPFRLANRSMVVFDLNYTPFKTELVKQAHRWNCSVIYGIDLLIAQGLEQFQLWTGQLNSVKKVIEETARDKYFYFYRSTSEYSS